MMTQDVPDVQVVEESLRLACRAPSLHNSQPWRWVVEDAGVQLFADRGRIGQSTDTSGRELVISCGAVLDHFRVAMVAAGWSASTDRFPNPNNLDHLASIDFSPLSFVTDAQRDRADAILRRRTDRLAFEPPTDWESFEPLLRQVFATSGAMLTVLGDEARPQLAEASRLTESLRRYDASYHAELQWWTTPLWVSQGVPPSALPTETEGQRVDVGRVFPAHGHGDRRTDVVADRSKILVISTPEDTRRDALGCGEALSAVLLECTMAGMATCTLTHMIEVESSRDIICGLTDDEGLPQVVVRVGMAPASEEAPPPTPRRPLTDVVEFRR
jgi:nitroreductase